MPTGPTTATAASPRPSRHRARSRTRRRTACRARSRSARCSRSGPAARPPSARARPAPPTPTPAAADGRMRAASAADGCRVTAACAATRSATAMDAWARRRDDAPIEERPRRNPPRDWAAPPPWAAGRSRPGPRRGARRAPAAGRGGAASRRPSAVRRPGLAGEGTGLAGSAADRLAGGSAGAADPDHRRRAAVGRRDSPSAPADPELAGLVGGGSAA